MAQEATCKLDGPLAEATIPSQKDIPDELEPGNYVVIDVASFSTTVVELLANGASAVHITAERGDEFAFQEEHPETVIGGGKTDEYEPHDGYDFFNSPSYIQSVDVEGRLTAMTSSNGGAAVTDLQNRAGDGVDVYVGSTINMKAVADHLRADDKQTIAVAAGSKGKPSPEDNVGAVLLHRYLDEDPPSETELDVYRAIIKSGKAAKYRAKPTVKHQDLLRYCMAVNTRDVVPKLTDGAFVDESETDT